MVQYQYGCLNESSYLVALSAQESKFADVGAVANCVGSEQNEKTGTTLPESADDRGSEINDGEEGGHQQQNS